MSEMKLMMVDDEERFLESMEKLLKRKGYDVVTATSGEQCLDKLAQEPFDVVILDVKMPGIDGVETLKRLKSIRPLTEVIMLTGHGTVENAVEGMHQGAFDYLLKPCDIDNLVSKMNGAFKAKQERDQRLREAEERSRFDKLSKKVRF